MIVKEVKTDGKIYKICICQNDKGKFQYVNLTKEKICPCEFSSYREAFVNYLVLYREKIN